MFRDMEPGSISEESGKMFGAVGEPVPAKRAGSAVCEPVPAKRAGSAVDEPVPAKRARSSSEELEEMFSLWRWCDEQMAK